MATSAGASQAESRVRPNGKPAESSTALVTGRSTTLSAPLAWDRDAVEITARYALCLVASCDYNLMTIVPPADHLEGWEYLYFASELARGLAEHQAEFEEYQSGTTPPTGEQVADPAARLKELSDESSKTVGNVSRLLSAQVLEGAFGPPGEAGDEVQIRGVASGLVDVYASMIAWGQQVRAASVPPEWRPAYLALSKYVALPLRQFQEFSTTVSTKVTKVVGELRSGKEPTDEITLALVVSVDPEMEKEFNAALAALRGKAGAATSATVPKREGWWRRRGDGD